MWVPDIIQEYQFRLHRSLRALWNLGQTYYDVDYLMYAMERTMTDIADMEAKVAAMEDADKAVKSAVDGVVAKMAAMKKEIDDLKAVAADNPALKDLADRLGKVHDDIVAEVATIAVSGGAA